MEGFLRLCGFCGLLSALVPIVRGRRSLRQTTLTVASSWSIAAAIGWIVCWAVDCLLSSQLPGLVDRLWYTTAVFSLAPAMSVLGARRPTTRVWPWFVILPMIVVLTLPLASSWQSIDRMSPLQLETPVLAGFALVLVMSAGNYVGTRFSLSALLFIAAMLLAAASVAAAVPDVTTQQYHIRLLAVGLLSFAVMLASRTGSTNATISPADTEGTNYRRFDRLWVDFRNLFGIVWARRLQDRINAVAQQEAWPVRLENSGFVPMTGVEVAEGPGTSDERIEVALRWFLRRFCDAEWIDARLGSLNPDSAATTTGKN